MGRIREGRRERERRGEREGVGGGVKEESTKLGRAEKGVRQNLISGYRTLSHFISEVE
jgi:hypothetical protein